MKVKTFCSMLFVVAMLSTAPLELSARTLGMVADGTIFEDNKFKVSVFNADTNAVLGTVDIPATDFFPGGTAITPDLKRGFVVNKGEVFVIDLTTPPRLATGTNPISISNDGGFALSISPNGKFLVVTGGFEQPISVIDIATRTEISTFPVLPVGSNATAVKVCSDNSVLVTTSFLSDDLIEGHGIRRLTLSSSGVLNDTGERFGAGEAVNVFCAPGAQSGVVITLDGEAVSFSVPGLRQVDNRDLSGVGVLTGTISKDRMVVLTSDGPEGLVDIRRFTQATGALSTEPLLTIPVTTVNAYIFGVDQIALHPNGKNLYVAERGAENELCAVDKPCAVNVYDLNTGAFIASITDPAIVQPLSITVATKADPCAGLPPRGSIKGNNRSNILNGTRGNDKIFGFGGNDKINGKGGNDLICGGSGHDQIKGGSGNDTIVAGSGNDRVNGNAGNDKIKGGSGYDRINGGPGRDRCTGEVLRRCNF